MLKEDKLILNVRNRKPDIIQGNSFGLLEKENIRKENIFCLKKIEKNYSDNSRNDNRFQIQNRRYLGNKNKLIEWIFSIIISKCQGSSFADIFAGTGIVSSVANNHFDKIILNDFLYSNYAIYKAFFENKYWDENRINSIIENYNNIEREKLEDNYFSKNFGGKYFSKNSSKIIGFIREDIERIKKDISEKEYFILLASLLYSVDKIANTVGHYDAFFKKEKIEDNFLMKSIKPIKTNRVEIFREDSNLLIKKLKADIVYLDPPYSSRQYSRFYHLLETIIKWNKPNLYGTALKPIPENMSDYCRISAKDKFEDLVNNTKAKYIVVSYNNTYNSKSNSSKNRITLEEIENILSKKGKLNIFEKDYRYFNAGNTYFNNHKEYLFLTKCL
jgi:adenine-specific DNA-methyltransferase